LFLELVGRQRPLAEQRSLTTNQLKKERETQAPAKNDASQAQKTAKIKNKRRRCRNRTPLSYAICFHINAMASSEKQEKNCYLIKKQRLNNDFD
jgi:RNase adaptor protein for sRNA GlmZ degradation